MKHNTFLVKPASSLCDLRCRYCFYDDVSSSRACKNMGLLSHEMARELIEKAFAATEDGGSVHFLFQGGEPTLAGLEFFSSFWKRSALEAQPLGVPQHPDQRHRPE